MPRKKIDLTARIYGRLTVIREVNPHTIPSGRELLKWLCQCECGNTKEIIGNSLKKGTTKSCGCLRA